MRHVSIALSFAVLAASVARWLVHRQDAPDRSRGLTLASKGRPYSATPATCGWAAMATSASESGRNDSVSLRVSATDRKILPLPSAVEQASNACEVRALRRLARKPPASKPRWNVFERNLRAKQNPLELRHARESWSQGLCRSIWRKVDCQPPWPCWCDSRSIA